MCSTLQPCASRLQACAPRLQPCASQAATLTPTRRAASNAWLVLLAIHAAPLGRRRLTVPPLLRLGLGWGLPLCWAAACELLLERKLRAPFRCWMVYGRPQYAAELFGLSCSLLMLVSRLGAKRTTTVTLSLSRPISVSLSLTLALALTLT